MPVVEYPYGLFPLDRFADALALGMDKYLAGKQSGWDRDETDEKFEQLCRELGPQAV